MRSLTSFTVGVFGQTSMNVKSSPASAPMANAAIPLAVSGVAVTAASPLTWRNATVQVKS